MAVTHLVANLWIHSKLLISARRLGEQVGIPYSRCGRFKAPYNWLKGDFERPWKERLIVLPYLLLQYTEQGGGLHCLPKPLDP